jgi:hypothetical protein
VINPAFAGMVDKLDNLIESVHRREAELTGSNYSAAEHKSEPLHRFKAADLLPSDPLPAFTWNPRPALRWVHSAVRKVLSRALDTYCRKVYGQLQLAFNAQIAHVVQVFAEQLKRARDRVTQVLGQQNDPERLSALKQLSEELDYVVRQIASAGGRPADASLVDGTRQLTARATDKRASKDRCALCEHLTTLIFPFMREYPYRLLKDPAERNRNAERGGMCPFHTWMYESTSSPQGICAGYAPVLLHLADRLDGVASIWLKCPANSNAYFVIC